MRTATFDIETNALLPDVTTVWCAAVLNHDTLKVTTFSPDNIMSLSKHLDKYDILIGHNCIAFDFPVLRKVFNYEYTGRVIDTLIISRTQRPNRQVPPTLKGNQSGPHSVESWGCRLGRNKVVYEQWEAFDGEMLHRCVEDVKIQYDIYHALLKEGKGEGWDMCHRLNAQLLRYLQRQEEYGWNVDQEHISKCLYFLNRWMDKIDATITPKLPYILDIKETKVKGEYNYLKKPFNINGKPSTNLLRYYTDPNFLHSVSGPFSRIGFRPISLDSSLEVKQYLLNLGWKPKEWNTDSNGKRTSPKLSKDDDFKGVQGSLGRLIVKRVQCKQRRGIIEGWQKSIRPDGRISARVGGFAVTGRLRHAGIVNVPNPETESFFSTWMRQIFITSPGMVMIGVDSKGNQIRQLAARMNDEEFTQSILYGDKEQGTDIHSINQRRAKTSTRTTAKNFFYGLIFGASNRKLSQYGNATREDFLRDLPSLQQLNVQLSNQLRKYGGKIKGLDGRFITVDSPHKALNSLLQSDEAIQMGAAYCWFHKQMENRGYTLHKDWGMLIWYHDEFVCEVRPEMVEEVKQLAEESIAWAGKFYNINCPHEGEAKEGFSWAEVH